MPINLFVYGTLRPESENEYSRYLEQKAKIVAKGKIKGKLFELDGYPIVSIADSTEGWIEGIVYEFKEGKEVEKILRILDEYEGENYMRKEVDVYCENNTKIKAIAYLDRHDRINTY